MPAFFPERARRIPYRIVLSGVLASLAAGPVAAAWLSGEQAIMGTSVRVELWADRESDGAALIDDVMQEMHRIDRLMSTWKDDSELSRLNRDAHYEPTPTSPELFDLIRRALTFSEDTGGAFDITYASVGTLYDYRAGVKPDDDSRRAALQAVDYHYVNLDPAKRTVHYTRSGVRIDLGGVAKGYAVERAVALLKDAGIRHAIVSAGGDSRILGDRRGRPWTVGIRDPRNRAGLVTRIPLLNEAISTSGDYERFFESDGRRYHHILTPGTGTSPDHVRSVSIIGPDGTMTDALSTGVFVLGVTDGMALIESLAPFEAVIIDADGALHYSSGLLAAQ